MKTKLILFFLFYTVGGITLSIIFPVFAIIVAIGWFLLSGTFAFLIFYESEFNNKSNE